MNEPPKVENPYKPTFFENLIAYSVVGVFVIGIYFGVLVPKGITIKKAIMFAQNKKEKKPEPVKKVKKPKKVKKEVKEDKPAVKPTPVMKPKPVMKKVIRKRKPKTKPEELDENDD